jgi:hypothetical protein
MAAIATLFGRSPQRLEPRSRGSAPDAAVTAAHFMDLPAEAVPTRSEY